LQSAVFEGGGSQPAIDVSAFHMM